MESHKKSGHDGMGQNLPPLLLWKRETGYCPCPCKSLQDTPYRPQLPTSLMGTELQVSARLWAASFWLPLVPAQVLNLTAQFKPRMTTSEWDLGGHFTLPPASVFGFVVLKQGFK